MRASAPRKWPRPGWTAGSEQAASDLPTSRTRRLPRPGRDQRESGSPPLSDARGRQLSEWSCSSLPEWRERRREDSPDRPSHHHRGGSPASGDQRRHLVHEQAQRLLVLEQEVLHPEDVHAKVDVRSHLPRDLRGRPAEVVLAYVSQHLLGREASEARNNGAQAVSPPQQVLFRAADQKDGLEAAPDVAGIPADVTAVALQHLNFVSVLVRLAVDADAPPVRVAGHRAQRAPLAV